MARKVEGLTERVTVLFTEEERALLDYISDNTAFTISSIVRTAALSHAQELAKKMEDGSLAAFMKPSRIESSIITKADEKG